MSTADQTDLDLEAPGAGAYAYDAFISYSHAADDLLAPRLQSALQRFAKPWWKRRAVRVFRDESSLSANPHLWNSITDAMDASRWFVLLLSPDAAQSEWVNSEVAYWVAHRGSRDLLPVVTSGDFGWSETGITGDAAPTSLHGVFDAEPRWVDLREIDSEAELDLKNPAFAAAVADMASTIRGIPKDELASEEVREHRRTLRTAWAAGVALLAFGIAAVIFGIAATRNANRAIEASVELERQRRIAEDNESEAERLARIAQANEAAAIEQAAVSRSGRLAASATTAVAVDAELSMLLLLEAYEIAPNESIRAELRTALKDVMFESLILGRFNTLPGRNVAALAPSGGRIYHAASSDRVLVSVDVASGEVAWEVELPAGEPVRVRVSPDDALVAVSVDGGDSPGRVVVLRADGGQVVAELVPGLCPRATPLGPGFSPDGRWFAVNTGSSSCGGQGEDEEDWAVVYDVATWSETARYSVPGGVFEHLTFSADSSRVVLSSWSAGTNVGTAEVLSFPSFELIRSVEVPVQLRPSQVDERGVSSFETWLHPDGGSFIHVSPPDPSELGGAAFVTPNFVWLVDIASGESLALELGTDQPRLDYPNPISISPDGGRIFVARQANEDMVFVSDGTLELRLYDNGDTHDHSWSADGTRLLTVHDTSLVLWAVTPDAGRVGEITAASDWAALAREDLTRGFTTGECSVYDIDPCPALDEIKSRE